MSVKITECVQQVVHTSCLFWLLRQKTLSYQWKYDSLNTTEKWICTIRVFLVECCRKHGLCLTTKIFRKGDTMSKRFDTSGMYPGKRNPGGSPTTGRTNNTPQGKAGETPVQVPARPGTVQNRGDRARESYCQSRIAASQCKQR